MKTVEPNLPSVCFRFWDFFEQTAATKATAETVKLLHVSSTT